MKKPEVMHVQVANMHSVRPNHSQESAATAEWLGASNEHLAEGTVSNRDKAVSIFNYLVLGTDKDGNPTPSELPGRDNILRTTIAYCELALEELPGDDHISRAQLMYHKGRALHDFAEQCPNGFNDDPDMNDELRIQALNRSVSLLQDATVEISPFLHPGDALYDEMMHFHGLYYQRIAQDHAGDHNPTFRPHTREIDAYTANLMIPHLGRTATLAHYAYDLPAATYDGEQALNDIWQQFNSSPANPNYHQSEGYKRGAAWLERHYEELKAACEQPHNTEDTKTARQALHTAIINTCNAHDAIALRDGKNTAPETDQAMAATALQIAAEHEAFLGYRHGESDTALLKTLEQQQDAAAITYIAGLYQTGAQYNINSAIARASDPGIARGTVSVHRDNNALPYNQAVCFDYLRLVMTYVEPNPAVWSTDSATPKPAAAR